MQRDDNLGDLVQVTRTLVVPQTGPMAQDHFLRCFGEGFESGETFQEPVKIGDHCLHPSLLEHDLRNENAVRIRVPSPR